MRTATTAVAAVLAFMTAGCGIELLTTTAVQTELTRQSASQAATVLDNTKDFNARTSLEHTLQAYHAEKGYYPPSLEALVPEYMASVPTRPDGTPFGYDPATGRVLDQPTETDAQKMERIRQAINQYGMATGWYPPSLEALVPTYLSSVPRSNSGQPFIYDMRTGALAAPRAAQAQPAPRAPAYGGGGGGTPMTEMMTGVGMQQELNRMSTGGSSAAGSRMRHNARELQTGQDERTNRTMDNLGL
jgi:hypothetical protein